MNVGIIGLPMSGKTTLFRLLTGAEAMATRGMRPEQRRACVDDSRLARLAVDFKPEKETPATIDFLDFPPVVRAEGGDRKSCADLLAPAREADALVVVLRAFENPLVPPIRGDVDPERELEDVLTELRWADLEIATRRVDRIDGSLSKKRGDERKSLAAERALLSRVVACLSEDEDIPSEAFSGPEQKQIRGFQFLSAKPRVVVENVGEGVDTRHADAIAVAVAVELELQDLDPDSRELFAEEYGVDGTGRQRVIREIYARSGCISFLTAGPTEVRAWTIREGTRAVDAAAAIHTDIARGFIRAEVVAYRDYLEDGGISGAREKGHFRLEGKEYVVQDGDVVLFRFSV